MYSKIHKFLEFCADPKRVASEARITAISFKVITRIPFKRSPITISDFFV